MDDDDDVGGAAQDVSIPTSDRQTPSADDFQIVETDDDYRPLKPQAEAEITSDDDGQDGQDEQVSRAGDGRPRLSKSERRRNQRMYRDRADQELRATREENEALKRRVDEFEQSVRPRLDEIDQQRAQDRINALQADINQTASAVLSAERRMSDAVMAGDAEAHSAALREHTLAMQKGNELAQTRQKLEQGGAVREKEPAPRQAQPVQQPQRQAEISPEVARLTRSFVDRHPFLDLKNGGANTDSRIALALDQEVAAEGFDPNDQDYWDELETRMRKYMPHRFPTKVAAAREQVAPQRRGPMVAGAGSSSPPGKRTVALTPARRKAMIDAGALDYDGRIADKGQFNRIAANYAEYDRQNSGSRQ